jgi:hypothetical protein
MSTMDQGMENETHNAETVRAADIAATAGKAGKGSIDPGVASSIMDWIPQVTKGLNDLAPLATSLLPFAGNRPITSDEAIGNLGFGLLAKGGLAVGDAIGNGLRSIFS